MKFPYGIFYFFATNFSNEHEFIRKIKILIRAHSGNS